MNYIGERLLMERRKRGMTQTDVAKVVGVSQTQISAIETGKQIDWPTIFKLCDLYQLDHRDLASGSLGMSTATERAITVDPEITAADRPLLLGIYKMMRARGVSGGEASVEVSI